MAEQKLPNNHPVMQRGPKCIYNLILQSLLWELDVTFALPRLGIILLMIAGTLLEFLAFSAHRVALVGSRWGWRASFSY